MVPSGVSLPDEGLIDEDALATLNRPASPEYTAMLPLEMLFRLEIELHRRLRMNGLDPFPAYLARFRAIRATAGRPRPMALECSRAVGMSE
jgi:hypothetical protein